MGQKTHPLGFRLGITQEHKSIWYANFNEYANLLEEDEQIRSYLTTLTKTASISDVKINRNGLGDQIQLNIETGRPGALVGENGLGLESLLKNIKKLVDPNRQISIKEVVQYYLDKIDKLKVAIANYLDIYLYLKFTCLSQQQ